MAQLQPQLVLVSVKTVEEKASYKKKDYDNLEVIQTESVKIDGYLLDIYKCLARLLMLSRCLSWLSYQIYLKKMLSMLSKSWLNCGGVVTDNLDVKLKLSKVLLFSDLLVRSYMEFVHKVKLLYNMPVLVEKLVFLPHAMKMYLYLHELDVTVD